MPSGPIRRAQMIAPFGVGSMVVVRDGTSLISGGLDHWFKRESGEKDLLDQDEYLIEEWRLQRRLGVRKLYLPPDYRRKRSGGDLSPNYLLTLPFLRFPQMHFCPRCKRLEVVPLTYRSFVECKECRGKGYKSYLVQVPFVAMCDHGHIQDFPWREWAHKSANPNCDKPLRLKATGGATLSAQKVECDCGNASRNLAQIMEAEANGSMTFLTAKLDNSGTPFFCQGKRPWLGMEEGSECSRPLRGTLRSASNVHFADVKSSIYLPRSNDKAPEELVSLLEEPPLSSLLNMLSSTGIEIKPEHLRKVHSLLLHPFDDAQIAAALKIVLSGIEETGDTGVADDDPETAFRRQEFEILRQPRDGDQLKIRSAVLSRYENDIVKYFSRIMLLDRLRETRALAGFTRILPENDLTQAQRRNLLWRQPPHGEASWLPAYVVYGEGIFLELDDERLKKWEEAVSVKKRVEALNSRYRQLQMNRRLQVILNISPRFILLHTFAHILMNRLNFECGYSSAALRERLYVSDNPVAPMAGVMIYTAAGDAEGTLGGLVRMGKEGYLEPVIRRALEAAKWCSADPVCMEMGSRGGQGPDSCNLAACHNCALVPETACEHFNRFLDRALVVRDDIGYFPRS